MSSRTQNELDYLMTAELGELVGQWIAVIDDEIVATGESGKEVFDKAMETHPDREPLIMQVPTNMVMLL